MMEDSRQLKALHIASGDLWAGAEVQLFTLVNELHSMPGITVEVILLNHGKLEQQLRNIGINVTVFDETQYNGIKILFYLINAIRKISPDVIHTHRIKENILGSIAAYLAGNIPSLRTVHGAPEHKPARHNIPKRLILLLDKYCGHLLQKRIIAVSDDLAEILQEDFPTSKIVVIENGIDAEPLIRSVKRSKSGEGAIKKTFKIGIAGRLVPVKRVDIFIQAANKLLIDHPELHISFHIFGDGPLRNNLETLNHKQNTEERIHFEGHCENMQQELQELDMLLIISDHEGLPMILLEAMVLQTPIIAHAVGGIPKLLDQGNCGILISDHQPSAYAEAIYQLLLNRGTRTDILQNAFTRVNTLYSSRKSANSYYDVYRACCVKKAIK